LLLVGLAVTACEGPQIAAPAKIAAAPPVAPIQPADPPPPAYVGLWAARPDLCPQGAWMIDEDKLATAGEVGCAFRSVSPTPDGFAVTATCTAESEPQRYRFNLAVAGAGAAQKMTVSRGPWDGPVTLVRCSG
jgi:hypothetical protein